MNSDQNFIDHGYNSTLIPSTEFQVDGENVIVTGDPLKWTSIMAIVNKKGQ
jgi:hypothetical protein